MKILLTGASGMCGRNILDHHCAKKYDILSPSSSELNLLEIDRIREYLLQKKPDLIIHTAGLVAGIMFNVKHSVNALVDNAYIGLNLINTAKEMRVPRLLNLASSCMYPRYGKNPLRETEILKGELEPTNEGYGLAKIMSTRLCEYICRDEFKLEYKTLIPCNLFGRHDTFAQEFSHMIPSAIRKLHHATLHKEEKVEIWGDGEARREFMSASDLADLVFYCLENFENMPQNLNAGLGHDYSINDYYKAAAKVVGFKGAFEYNLSKPVGMKQKLVDVSLLREFGWEHNLSLDEGLAEAYSFYRDEWHLFKSNTKVKDVFFDEY